MNPKQSPLSSKRFSIATLLLLIALVAAAMVIYRERSTISSLEQTLAQRNTEVGFIDSSKFKSTEGAIRCVEVEGTDIWKYRVVLPENHGYLVEYILGDPDNPTEHSLAPLNYSGQFNLVIHRAIDYLKPNNQPREVFVTSVVDQSNKAQVRLGIPWRLEKSASFRNSLGHYSNAAGPNRNELQRFHVDKDVVLLFNATYSPKQKEGELFRIQLVPKSMAKPPAESP